jgi:hydrogenase nickel incorporation protein HypA/HybF
MHEHSLMKSLMKRIEEVAAEAGGGRVVGIKVWLGAFSHMSESHFEEHFRDASRGSLAEGARIEATVSDDQRDPRAQDIFLESVELEA